MANHKSAKKRSRQTVKKNLVNKVRISEVRTAVKKIREAISNKNKEEALKEFPIVQTLFAKMAKIGVIKANNAARKTSRLASQVSKL